MMQGILVQIAVAGLGANCGTTQELCDSVGMLLYDSARGGLVRLRSDGEGVHFSDYDHVDILRLRSDVRLRSLLCDSPPADEYA